MGRGTEGDGDGDGEWSTNGLVGESSFHPHLYGIGPSQQVGGRPDFEPCKNQPHLYDVSASQQVGGRPDFEPGQNRARESRERDSVLFCTERPRGEAPRAPASFDSLVVYMRGHSGAELRCRESCWVGHRGMRCCSAAWTAVFGCSYHTVCL